MCLHTTIHVSSYYCTLLKNDYSKPMLRFDLVVSLPDDAATSRYSVYLLY
jgi:hypothetical protein